MRIFYLEWNSFGNEDMITAMEDMGYSVIRIPFPDRDASEEEIAVHLEKEIKQGECDFLFSFNYFPNVSNCCEKKKIKYVSWVYDSPYLEAYSYTVLNPCNYLFLFDYAMYEELKQAGIQTVYYLPLAVSGKRLSGLQTNPAQKKQYSCEVAFVGSMYSELKHRLYDRMQGMEEYEQGYLEGLVQAQALAQGCNFLQEMLTPELVDGLERIYPSNPNASTVLSKEAIYADYILARKATAIERQEIMKLLGRGHEVFLYTHDAQAAIPGVINKGAIDYYRDMPHVFQSARINLNISLRSIKTGIPLRAFDIMGCGGFLLSNYQEELFWYFEPEKDFVYYEDWEDLCDKVSFYLIHEKERREIAENGRKKVLAEHTFEKRLAEIVNIVAKG